MRLILQMISFCLTNQSSPVRKILGREQPFPIKRLLRDHWLHAFASLAQQGTLFQNRKMLIALTFSQLYTTKRFNGSISSVSFMSTRIGVMNIRTFLYFCCSYDRLCLLSGQRWQDKKCILLLQSFNLFSNQNRNFDLLHPKELVLLLLPNLLLL